MMIKRPLLWCAGAYALGEVLALQSGGLWPAVMFLAAGAVMVWLRIRRRRQPAGEDGAGQNRRIFRLVLPLLFMLGFVRLLQAGDSFAVREVDRYLETEGELSAELSGRVARIELRTVSGRKSFRLLVSGCVVRMEEPEGKDSGEEGEVFPIGTVLLSLDELPKEVREGRSIAVKARLSEMEEAGNPGQFDGRGYYRGQGISYRAKGVRLLEVSGQTDYLRMGLRHLRQQFSEHLFRAAGEENGGMLCAMVLGEKWEADAGSVSLYTESGMGHLLAISGLHISLAGMGVYRLLRKRLRYPYVPAALGCTAMSFCYYLLTGEGTSAGRAFFMLTVYGIGQVLGRQYDLATAAALSAFAMLLFRPLLLFQSGFLLSFGSVLSLGMLYPLLLRARLPRLFTPILPGLSIQLVTLPVQAYFFYKFPVYSLFLNLAVLPLFTAVALFGIAGALLGGQLPAVLFLPARGILWLYEHLGEWSLRLPGAVWRTGRPKMWQLLLYGLLLLFFCRWLKRRESGAKTARMLPGKSGRKALRGLLPLLGMLLSFMPVRYRGMELTFLDVGQGDSCFLRTAEGFTFLVDGGSSDQKNVGEYRLGPFLDAQAQERVDFALVSHGDADHISGIRELLEQGRIGTLILPRGREGSEGLGALREAAGQAGVAILFLGRGERLRVGEAEFTCFWPEDSGRGGGGALDENESSMVLWLSWRELDVLFTGDLEGSGETAVTAYLEAFCGALGKTVDVLKVPHHGSGGAGSEEFLETVAPEFGIISCGRHNSYGHPAKETLERLAGVGCRVFRTDQDGAVTVRSDGKRIEVDVYKK